MTDNIIILDFNKMVKEKYPELNDAQVEHCGKTIKDEIEAQLIPAFEDMVMQLPRLEGFVK